MTRLRLTQSESGVESLEEHLRWPFTESPLSAIEDTLFPVLDMLALQRVIVDHEFQQVAPAAGQSVVFTYTVPNNLAWKIVHLTGLHAEGAVVHLWTIAIVRASGPIFRIATVEVSSNVPTPILYGRKVRGATPTDTLWDHPGGAIELFPNDIFTVTVSNFAAAGTADLTMRLERIPLPRQQGGVVIETTGNTV